MGELPLWAGSNFDSETFVATPAVGAIGGFFVRGTGKKLVGVRAIIAAGSCKLKVRRTTALGVVSEPAKEIEAGAVAAETVLSVALANNDLLELVCESVNAPGLLYCTYAIRHPR